MARSVRTGASIKHGIYAEVAVRPDVLDEVAIMFARAAWLDERRDGPLVESTSRIIVRLRKLDAYLAEEANPSIALSSMLSRLEGQLTRNLAELGLSPTSAARLGIDLHDLRARMRQNTEATLDRYRKPKAVVPDPEEATDSAE